MIDQPLAGWVAPRKVVLSQWMYDRICRHLTACLPEEGCGLLAALPDGRVKRHFPIENSLHSHTRYQLEPRQQLRAMLWMEANPARQMIIYHSHPTGPDHLSETDLAECSYPTSLQMLFHRRGRVWHANLYRMEARIPVIVNWEIG